MKYFTICFLLFISALVDAQTPVFVTPLQWDSLKKTGQLQNGLYAIRGNNQQTNSMRLSAPNSAAAQSTACNCMIPLDTSFRVVPFTNSIGPDYRNDDDSSPLITIQFYFCFYGQTYNQIYINNNGNVSFINNYGTYSANGFPDPSFIMIAPFWADVDTQNPTSGLVYYKITSTALIVRWQNVGYFNSNANKLNDFQLILTDGFDPILPAGSNASFCYGDMQWTTGDASNGVNGFGGIPATVGANLGDGVSYFQIGRFDQAGNTYNGPNGSPSGISWLDNQSFFFDLCVLGSGYTFPPIMSAQQTCDTFNLCVGDTLPINATFLCPDSLVSSTITVNATSTGYSTLTNTPGNTSALTGEFVGLASNIGMNTITIIGTDNTNPPKTTSGNIVVNVIPGPTAQFTSTSVCPGSQMSFNSSGSSTIPTNGPLLSWHWEFNDPANTNGIDTSNLQTPNYTYSNSGVYNVNLTVTDSLGCSDTVNLPVTVYLLPVVQFTADPTTSCPPLCANFTDQSTVTGSTVTEWLWNFGDGNTDTVQNPQNCYQNSSYYTVTLTATSAEGCSKTDSIPQLINVIPAPVAAFSVSSEQISINAPSITCTDLTSGSPSSWSWYFGMGNDSSSVQNPSYTYKDTGTYCIQLIAYGPNQSCPDTAIECVVVLPELLMYVPNSFSPDNNGLNDIFKPSFNDIAYISDFRMSIFDRWGNLVFTTNRIDEGWDGRTQSGNMVISDTYVYMITFASRYASEQQEYVGHLNVVR